MRNTPYTINPNFKTKKDKLNLDSFLTTKAMSLNCEAKITLDILGRINSLIYYIHYTSIEWAVTEDERLGMALIFDNKTAKNSESFIYLEVNPVKDYGKVSKDYFAYCSIALAHTTSFHCGKFEHVIAYIKSHFSIKGNTVSFNPKPKIIRDGLGKTMPVTQVLALFDKLNNQKPYSI